MSDEEEPLVRQLTVVNARGLHARAAAKFVKLAGQFDAEIRLSKDGITVSGMSIMGLMMLAAAKGCCVELSTSGREAMAAMGAIADLVEDGFGERD
jgi:phosphocarrier protein HPr